MCGIIYARAKNDIQPINKLVIKQFRNQRSRGIQGFGVYDFDYKHIIHEPEERKILKWLKNHPTHEMMFHHRMPTSTNNVKSACHPFSTKDYFGETEYILLHNGVISNYKEMAKDHLEKGIVYNTVQDDGRFNDSEALMWDVALYMEGRQTELKSRGSCAFILLEKHKENPKENRLHWFHNSGHTTLFKRDNSKVFMLSSEGGQGANPVEVNQLFTYNYGSEKTEQRYLWLPNGLYQGSYTPSTQSSTQQSSIPYRDFDDDLEARRAIANQVAMFADEEEPESRAAQAISEALEDEEKQFKLLEDNKGFANKLKAKVREFMSYADGNYSDALFLLKGELKDTSMNTYTLDNWYEMQQLGGAIAILLADPFWDGEDKTTLHPVFTKNDSRDPENWDGSSVAPIVEPLAVLDQTKQNKGTKHIADVIAHQAAEGKWGDHLFERHKTSTTPELVARIPVLP